MTNLINMGKNCCTQDPCNPNCNGTYAIDSFTISANSPATGGLNSAIDSWDGTTIALGTTFSEEGMNTSNRCSENRFLLLDCAVTKLSERNFTNESYHLITNLFQQIDHPGPPLRRAWDAYKRVWNMSKDVYFLQERTTVHFFFSILPSSRFSIGVTINYSVTASLYCCQPYLNGLYLDPSLRNDKLNWNQCSFSTCVEGDSPVCTSNPVSTFRTRINDICCGAGRNPVVCPTSPEDSNPFFNSYFGDSGISTLPYDPTGSASRPTIGGFFVNRTYSSGILSYSDCTDICGPLTLNLNSVFAPGTLSRANGVRYRSFTVPTSGNYLYHQSTDPPDQYILQGTGSMQSPGATSPPDYLSTDYVNGLSSPQFPSGVIEWFAGNRPFPSAPKYEPPFTPYPGHTTIEIEEPLHAPSIQVTLSQCQPGLQPM